MSAVAWHGGEFLDEQMNARKQRLEAMGVSNESGSALDENAPRKHDSSENVGTESSTRSTTGPSAAYQSANGSQGQGSGWNDPVLVRREAEMKKPAFLKDERRAPGIFRIKQLSSEQLGGQESYQQEPDNDTNSDEICRRISRLEVEDSAVEAEKLREHSRSWAMRESLTSSQIIELEMLMNLITSTYIPRSSIEGLRQIDKGKTVPRSSQFPTTPPRLLPPHSRLAGLALHDPSFR
jgi:hypothetical protein